RQRPPASGRGAGHARTPSTSRSRHWATVRPGPTFTEWPCSRLTVAKPYSSVVSSPMNTGVLPRNGSSCMNSSTATPLSFPAGFISTMRLPVCTQYWLRSDEHTSELQSLVDLVYRLLLVHTN